MERRWVFRKELNLSTVVQMCLLASLVLGSWMRVERRLEVLQHDVRQVLARQEALQSRTDNLAEKTLGHEYRLSAIEGSLSMRRRGGE